MTCRHANQTAATFDAVGVFLFITLKCWSDNSDNRFGYTNIPALLKAVAWCCMLHLITNTHAVWLQMQRKSWRLHLDAWHGEGSPNHSPRTDFTIAPLPSGCFYELYAEVGQHGKGTGIGAFPWDVHGDLYIFYRLDSDTNKKMWVVQAGWKERVFTWPFFLKFWPPGTSTCNRCAQISMVRSRAKPHGEYWKKMMVLGVDVDIPVWEMHFDMGVFKNWKTPQIIHFNRVFHYFHHPFWGPTSLFLETPILVLFA